MLEKIMEQFPEETFMRADGFDDAIIGVCDDFNNSMRLIYSISKSIEILMKDMSYEDAQEYFYFNIKGAYIGAKTPIWCFDDFVNL